MSSIRTSITTHHQTQQHTITSRSTSLCSHQPNNWQTSCRVVGAYKSFTSNSKQYRSDRPERIHDGASKFSHSSHVRCCFPLLAGIVWQFDVVNAWCQMRGRGRGVRQKKWWLRIRRSATDLFQFNTTFPIAYLRWTHNPKSICNLTRVCFLYMYIANKNIHCLYIYIFLIAIFVVCAWLFSKDSCKSI